MTPTPRGGEVARLVSNYPWERPSLGPLVRGGNQARVLAERFAAGERARFTRLFDQAYSFMAILQGPTHVIALANPGAQGLVHHPHADGAAVGDSLLERGMEVMTKPFAIADLAERVRRLIER